MPLMIGLMSGTSLDGIDAALVRCSDDHPPRLLATHGEVMPDELRQALWELTHADTVSFAHLARLETQFTRLQAETVAALLTQADTKAEEIAAIGSHGQTIEHRPDDDFPWTCQLDNPSLLAELTGCPVVGDFRRRDLAAGGQGAPLAPAFHAALFRDPLEWRVLLNLGGFANVSLLPPTGSTHLITGFDTGPANALMDGWYARHHAGTFDRDGAWAATGRVNNALLQRLLADPFFHRPPPRSTGREHFHQQWLDEQLTGQEMPEDVQATLLELTAKSIRDGIVMGLSTSSNAHPVSVVPCGGGAHNHCLIERLTALLAPMTLLPCEHLGWSPDWLEAGAFAWLAWRRLNGQPGNLATVTGAQGARVLGGLYAR
ncbi:anhydro-N-acetylmuramic acid kinase [Kushneria phosphatilytica]|uniref:Anhydro-N-acetylmuramic acid kinase n=1 Tax=Kushneria phosphatilytica TaxID=657387 RepID=A0A1S1NW90_9GAMM|nr:anhydro-N-acetylmuramic acid kinase [Kushneria phosphatilytica]OHV11257.1 anhydro-N-acetylmuramic acid kinase [Kushneria phosphatilytica]QEL12168.1 anhydro-N-acetylmuramic acid kinase [Kushneria phosphatilytica]